MLPYGELYLLAGLTAVVWDCVFQLFRFGRIVAKWPTLVLIGGAWPVWLAVVCWLLLRVHLVDHLYARERAKGDRL